MEPRKSFGLCSPKTQRIASATLLFPHPFGPTIAVIPGLKSTFSLSAKDLVNLTHRENSPWYISDRGKSNNKIISDDIILKNHKYETI